MQAAQAAPLQQTPLQQRLITITTTIVNIIAIIIVIRSIIIVLSIRIVTIVITITILICNYNYNCNKYNHADAWAARRAVHVEEVRLAKQSLKAVASRRADMLQGSPKGRTEELCSKKHK